MAGSLGIVLILIAQKLLGELKEIQGYALQTAGLFFLGGVQMLLLGILGEYIGRIHSEVKGRPLFVVERRLGFGGETGPPAAPADEIHENSNGKSIGPPSAPTSRLPQQVR